MFHADRCSGLGAQAEYLAVLENFDAQCRGCPGVTPGDGIVPDGSTARLKQATHDGKASRPVHVEGRLEACHSGAIEQHGVDP